MSEKKIYYYSGPHFIRSFYLATMRGANFFVGEDGIAYPHKWVSETIEEAERKLAERKDYKPKRKE